MYQTNLPVQPSFSSFALFSHIHSLCDRAPSTMKLSVLFGLVAAIANQTVMATPASPPAPGALFDRQLFPICCLGECYTVVNEPSNEKTEIMHKQVSEYIDCNGGPGCSVTRLTSHTIGWSASVGGNIPWASLGASVTESTTTGNSYTCNGEGHNKVCVWARIEHKSYDVIMDPAIQADEVCETQPYGPYRIFAPTGSVNYYCVYDDGCGEDGDQYFTDP